MARRNVVATIESSFVIGSSSFSPVTMKCIKACHLDKFKI